MKLADAMEDLVARRLHEEWLRNFHARCDKVREQAVQEVRLAFCYAFAGDDFKLRLVELGMFTECENVGTMLVSLKAYKMAEPYMRRPFRRIFGKTP